MIINYIILAMDLLLIQEENPKKFVQRRGRADILKPELGIIFVNVAAYEFFVAI